MTRASPFLSAGAIPAEQFPGAEQEPLEYPGKRPDFSFCYGRGKVLPIETTAAGQLRLQAGKARPLFQDVLTQHHAPPLSDRYLVLAIGSNACPGRLKEKFDRELPREIFPVFRGVIANLDAVYGADLAVYGAVPATCVAAPGCLLQAWATLLSPAQLERMNQTESVGSRYLLVEVPGAFRFDSWDLKPIYAYYLPHVLALDGTPVRMAAFRATNASFPARDQREVLADVLNRLGFHPRLCLEERHRMLREDEAVREEISEHMRNELQWSGAPLDPGRAVEISRMQHALWDNSSRKGCTP